MALTIITETERLIIRHFARSDFEALYEIMKKPEVMYAWEHGFSESETHDWIDRQINRYHDDGYGYFAVVQKESGKLIGQAGLLKNAVNGDSIVEIGYIFDDTVWGNGYALEACHSCVDLALKYYRIDKLYATIRPENTASAKLTLKLGMMKIGEFEKFYQGKAMPHDIYLLEIKPEVVH